MSFLVVVPSQSRIQWTGEVLLNGSLVDIVVYGEKLDGLVIRNGWNVANRASVRLNVYEDMRLDVSIRNADFRDGYRCRMGSILCFSYDASSNLGSPPLALCDKCAMHTGVKLKLPGGRRTLVTVKAIALRHK